MADKDLFRLPPRDGIAPAYRRWGGAVPPRAVMVVAHGMGEHSGRYRDPLNALIDEGVLVYAIDHRGHGHTAWPDLPFGDFGPGGFAGVVEDLLSLVDHARAEHPALPLVLFGHSMGSMIAQAFLLAHAERIDGLILCGPAAVDVIAAAAMRDPGIFASLNQPFEPARTPFDWLSRDPDQVDAYLADRFCGFSLVPGSFADLLGQGAGLADLARLARIPHDLPVLVISGEMDPLNVQLNALVPLVERYRAAGLRIVTRTYPEARHEILNEINRAEVLSDIAQWLDGVGLRAA